MAGANGSDDGRGAEARFANLEGITADGSHFYVTDWGNT